MKILFLAQLFELDDEFDSDRHWFHCRSLVEAGHEVSVITSNVHYKTGKAKHPARGFETVRRVRDGIDIHYVYSPTGFLGSYRKRLGYYLAFMWFSRRVARKLQADLVYAVTPSLSVAVMGRRFSRRLRADLVLEVSDLWPDVLIETGFLRNPFIIGLLKRVEKKCYRSARSIVCLSRGIRDGVIRRIPDEAHKVHLISNGVNPALFTLPAGADRKVQALRHETGVNNRFVCLYLGAHNRYNALFTILDAAELLRADPDILFVLIGDGDKKANLQGVAKERGLDNLIFLPPVPRRECPYWLQMADLFLLPNLKGSFYRLNLQNKFFDFLASGKPILFAGSGESAEIIRRCRCGRIVPAEDARAMAAAIQEVRGLSAAERSVMGQRAQAFVMSHYNRRRMFRKLQHLIEKGGEKNERD